MADQQLVDEVDGPEDPVDEQQEPTVVIMPTDHQRVEAEDEIDDARVTVVHIGNEYSCEYNKKEAIRPLFVLGVSCNYRWIASP